MSPADPIPDFEDDIQAIQQCLIDLSMNCAKADRMDLAGLLLAHSQALGYTAAIIESGATT